MAYPSGSALLSLTPRHTLHLPDGARMYMASLPCSVQVCGKRLGARLPFSSSLSIYRGPHRDWRSDIRDGDTAIQKWRHLRRQRHTKRQDVCDDACKQAELDSQVDTHGQKYIQTHTGIYTHRYKRTHGDLGTQRHRHTKQRTYRDIVIRHTDTCTHSYFAMGP